MDRRIIFLKEIENKIDGIATQYHQDIKAVYCNYEDSYIIMLNTSAINDLLRAEIKALCEGHALLCYNTSVSTTVLFDMMESRGLPITCVKVMEWSEV